MSVEMKDGNNDGDDATTTAADAAFEVANDDLSVLIVEIVFLPRTRNVLDFFQVDPPHRPTK
jgi:hypothetical protein